MDMREAEQQAAAMPYAARVLTTFATITLLGAIAALVSAGQSHGALTELLWGILAGTLAWLSVNAVIKAAVLRATHIHITAIKESEKR